MSSKYSNFFVFYFIQRCGYGYAKRPSPLTAAAEGVLLESVGESRKRWVSEERALPSEFRA